MKGFFVLPLRQFELDLCLVTKNLTNIIKVLYLLKYCYLLVSGVISLVNELWALKWHRVGFLAVTKGRALDGQ